MKRWALDKFIVIVAQVEMLAGPMFRPDGCGIVRHYPLLGTMAALRAPTLEAGGSWFDSSLSRSQLHLVAGAVR